MAIVSNQSTAVLNEKFLSPDELAAKLGISKSTLAMWRHDGEGPAWYKLGKSIGYLPTDVREWLERFRHEAVR